MGEVLYTQVRLKNKHDTQVTWDATDFIPLAGEIVIYDADESNTVARVKIGDGVTDISELPFIDANSIKSTDAITTAQIDAICEATI